jgi:hypothetical protein
MKIRSTFVLAVSLVVGALIGYAAAPAAAVPVVSFTVSNTTPAYNEIVTATSTTTAAEGSRYDWRAYKQGGNRLGYAAGYGPTTTFVLPRGTWTLVLKVTEPGSTNNFRTAQQVLTVA